MELVFNGSTMDLQFQFSIKMHGFLANLLDGGLCRIGSVEEQLVFRLVLQNCFEQLRVIVSYLDAMPTIQRLVYI